MSHPELLPRAEETLAQAQARANLFERAYNVVREAYHSGNHSYLDEFEVESWPCTICMKLHINKACVDCGFATTCNGCGETKCELAFRTYYLDAEGPHEITEYPEDNDPVTQHLCAKCEPLAADKCLDCVLKIDGVRRLGHRIECGHSVAQ
jgi:hypothetical protein